MNAPHGTPFESLEEALDAACDYAFGNADAAIEALFEGDPYLTEALLQVRYEEARNSYERFCDIEAGYADVPARLVGASDREVAREIGRKKSGARAFWRTISTKIAHARALQALAERA